MIVVSVLEREWGALRAQALAQAPLCDRVELRLDHVGNPGPEGLAELVRAIGKPVIAAVNGPDAHGFFRGGREERFATLDAAVRAGAAFVDVDWKDARLMPPLPESCRRVVSRHEDVLPPLEDAWKELGEVSRKGDVLKLVVHARCGEDGVRMLESTRAQEREVVGFASGEAGSFTRALAVVFGSSWTYAAPARVAEAPEPRESAPGQVPVDVLRATWPVAGVTRGTRVFGVLGRPAAHSLSPAVHGAAARKAGLDAVYVAIEPDELAAFLSLCHAPNWAGFSVTAPFKAAAFERAAEHDEHARAARAANTLVRAADGTWSAHNTDVPAIARVVAHALESAGRRLDQTRALVLGTGGAARAAVIALQSKRLQAMTLQSMQPRSEESAGAHVTVAGRDLAARSGLAQEFGCAACSLEEAALGEFDVLVNCTPVGSRAQAGKSPIDARVLRAGMIVVDAVYRPARTPLLIEAEQNGALAVPGTAWFLRQAALQFGLFTQRMPDETAMRAVLEHELAADRVA